MQSSKNIINFNSIVQRLQQTTFLSKLDYLSFSIVLLLGPSRLAEPLWGDQALFTVGAKAIHDGDLLYRDFWDLKSPGIYGLYALAGHFFGFTSIGLHTIELIWMLALAIVLRMTLVPHFKDVWIVKILPWLLIGSYFTKIDCRQQMQVESLMGLPIYLTIWFTVKAAQQPEKRWRWLMLSGVAAGIVLIFKTFYLPLILALWSVYFAYCLVKQRQPAIPALWQTSWPLAVGVLLPIIPIALYWSYHGLWGDVFYALVEYPRLVIQHKDPRPLSALQEAAGWFIRAFIPLIVFASFGIYRSLQRFNLLTTQLLVWLVLGLIQLLLQSQSWWAYHFLFLLVPLSIFAAYGIQWIVDVTRTRGTQAFADRRLLQVGLLGCCVWLMIGQLKLVSAIGSLVLQTGIPITAEEQLAYQMQTVSTSRILHNEIAQNNGTAHNANSHINHIAPLYRAMYEDALLLKQGNSLPGDIYVLGNPALYLLTDRGQAVSVNGWSPTMLLDSQWQLLREQLANARPNYVYIMRQYEPVLESGLISFLKQLDYAPVQQSELGTWYQIKETLNT
jgi:hypothetical protein